VIEKRRRASDEPSLLNGARLYGNFRPEADLGHFGKLTFLCTAAMSAPPLGSRTRVARAYHLGSSAEPYAQITTVRLKTEKIQLVADAHIVGTGATSRKGLLQGHFLEKGDRQNL
jgi:hypothetical protein